MTKSELIERLASQQSHIPAKAVEDAVKEMLEHMASTLAQGERIEIRGFGSFLCTIVHPAPDVIRKRAIKWIWKGNTFRTLSRVKNCVTAPIFMKVKFQSVLKPNHREKHRQVLFSFLVPILEAARKMRVFGCKRV
jgi:integration host factor subunit beta